MIQKGSYLLSRVIHANRVEYVVHFATDECKTSGQYFQTFEAALKNLEIRSN